jgi:two-component system LytT family sensor kinase
MRIRHLPGTAYWAAWLLACSYNFIRDAVGANLPKLLMFNISHFLVWSLLGLVAMPLMRRYPIHLHWRSWLFHIVLGSVLTQIDLTLGHWLFAVVTGAFAKRSFLEMAWIAFKTCFNLGLLTYFGFLAVVQGHDTLKLARLRELQVADHKTAMVKAQLQSLKLQLQPHFLFNTIHAIGALMHYDVPTADRMLTRLSEVLRTSLRESDSPVVTLRQEVAFIKAYVEIEKIRFENRLSVDWVMPDHLQESPIPPFILQPLVENAIKYGIAPRANGGCITIRAYPSSDALILEVEDDAPDHLPQQQGFGIGLRNTRSRLAALYGEGPRFELLRGGAGTIARIRIPLAVSLEKMAA